MLEALNFVGLGKKLDFTADEFQELKPVGKRYGIFYGYSIAISGDSNTIAISATRDNDVNSGLVYVYRKQGSGKYVQVQVIAQKKPQLRYTIFGEIVRLSDDGRTLLITDSRVAISETSVLEVYALGSSGDFEHKQTLRVDDDVDAYTSVNVTADGSTITVTSASDLQDTDAVGTVFVFTKDSGGQYSLTQRLNASGLGYISYFGYSAALSIDGSAIVVGAPLDTGAEENSGSAYIFTRNSSGLYTQTQKIYLADGELYNFFGNASAISGDGSKIVVCAGQVDNPDHPPGAAYVFVRQSNGQYVLTNKLLADRGTSHYREKFGSLVTVNADCSRILVTTEREENEGNARVFMFTLQENGGYSESTELKPEDLTHHMRYGESMAIASDGSFVIVGAHYLGARQVINDEGINGEVLQPGSVYVFN